MSVSFCLKAPNLLVKDITLFRKHALTFPTLFAEINSLDSTKFQLKCSLFQKLLLDLLSWNELVPVPQQLVYTLLWTLFLVDFVFCDLCTGHIEKASLNI